jgi:hypothetical protein
LTTAALPPGAPLAFGPDVFLFGFALAFSRLHQTLAELAPVW